MMSAEAEPLDEERRAFVVVMLQRMPEALSRAMLAEEITRAQLSLPAAGTLGIFEARFDGNAVMHALRAIANGAAPDLSSVNGAVRIVEGRLEPDGAAVMVAGDQGARFAAVGLLSDDREVRRRTLETMLVAEDLELGDEARLHAAVEKGPIGEELFVELETIVEATPKAVYRRLAAEAAEGVTYDALVPTEVRLFEQLLGGAPRATLGEFRSAWLARTAALDPVRRARWIALTAPLAILRGDMVARAADDLDRDVRLRLARFLAEAPDPLSQLAGFEIAAAGASDAEFRAVADRVLLALITEPDERAAAGLSLLSSAVVLTATVSARQGAMGRWPEYARRLAWYLHASMLVRSFGGGAIDAEGMRRAIGIPLEGNYRLVELCDARTAPFGLWGAISPARLRAVILARVTRFVADLAEDARPGEWIEAVAAATAAAADRPHAFFLLAPGPTDPFEDDWAGQIELTNEMARETIGRMESGEEDERGLSDLFNLAVAFELTPEWRSEFCEAVPKLLARLPDDTFTLAADTTLQLAARWKAADLAERIVDLALARKAAGGLTDVSAPARLAMLGGASNADIDLCARKTGEYMASFAYGASPGAEVRNLLAAIDLLGDFAPWLLPSLASARSFLLLAHDLLPLSPK